MDISAFKSGYYTNDMTRDLLGKTKSQLDDLQMQLNTSMVSSTYGGLGQSRVSALSLNGKISASTGYLNTITNASTRVNFLNSALTQLSANVASSRASNLYSYTFSAGSTLAQQSAENYLSEAVDALNTDVAGQYIFSGRSSTTKPVVDVDSMLNGAAGQDGVKQLIAEQKAADLGTGTGRLNISATGNMVSVAEDVVPSAFGMKLSGVSVSSQSSPSQIAATGPSAGTVGVTFNGVPSAGDSVTLKLALPDGSETSVTLTATNNSPPAAGQFTIGSDANATTANFQTAMTSSIQQTASTTLAAASAMKGAQNFFAGSNSNPPQRIGQPYASATGYMTAADADAAGVSTVIWYQGDDDPTVAARDTSAQRVDTNQVVGIGARANEPGIQTAMAQWSVMAAETFDPNSTTDQTRYTALSERMQAGFNTQPGKQSVQDIASDISIANASLTNAKASNTQRVALYQGALADIELPDPATLLTQISTLQTRLQASYQVTGIMSTLSLANFLK